MVPAQLRVRAAVALTMAALCGCEGKILWPAATPAPPPQQKCEPGVHEVPKLLRVSNHEYQSLVSDLVGTPVTDDLFTRWTPIAQVYGFDTMSESRIDAHGLEEQLATAERLAALVLGAPTMTAHCPTPAAPEMPACPLKATYSSAQDFSDTQGRDCWSYLDSSGTPMLFDTTRSLWRKEPDQTVLNWSNGMHPGSTVDAVRRWKAAVQGAVTLTGRFQDADPGGGDGVVVSIRKNGTEVLWTRTLSNGGDAAFELTARIARGDVLDFVVGRNQNPSYDSTAVSIAIGLTPTATKAGWTWDNCVQPLITRLASRGFRRPVRADELADYQQLFESSRAGATAAGLAEPTVEAMSTVVQAVLLSPSLVFKPELVPGGFDPAERGYATASRLAFFTRGSIADEPLWTLAGTGALEDSRAVEAQARRLLEAELPRFTQHFGGQWLDFRDAQELGALTASMQAEASGVFREVLASDLPPQRLLSPGFTVADAKLAQHYGLPFTQDARLVTSQRGGLLSQALFLTRTATGSEFRRPIHRGLWALTRLLCRSLPRLDAATLEEISNSVGMIDRELPIAQQMALHRKNAARCSGCHDLMDPIGLALENYDRVGLWRDAYANGAPITSNLEFDGVLVRDPHALSAAIEASPDFRACVATKLLTFGLYRGPLEEEACVAKEISTLADGGTPSLKQMTVDALVKSLKLTELNR